MCSKLPSLFTKAYNRLLAEQYCETLQASVNDKDHAEVVYQYGTFARVHEKLPQTERSGPSMELKLKERGSTTQHSTAATKVIDGPSTNDINI